MMNIKSLCDYLRAVDGTELTSSLEKKVHLHKMCCSFAYQTFMYWAQVSVLLLLLKVLNKLFDKSSLNVLQVTDVSIIKSRSDFIPVTKERTMPERSSRVEENNSAHSMFQRSGVAHTVFEPLDCTSGLLSRILKHSINIVILGYLSRGLFQNLSYMIPSQGHQRQEESMKI